MAEQPAIRIGEHPSLNAFFHEELCRHSRQHHLDPPDATLWYLTQLLTAYSRANRFFDDRPEGGTLTPLAEYYRLATEAGSRMERGLYLRRLGDVAMFIVGRFAGALRRRPVGPDYYVSMGEAAYATLARDGEAGEDIYADLAGGFARYAAVLGDIGQPTDPGAPQADEVVRITGALH